MVELFLFKAKSQPLLSTDVQLIYSLFKDWKASGIMSAAKPHPQTPFEEAECRERGIGSGLGGPVLQRCLCVIRVKRPELPLPLRKPLLALMKAFVCTK